MTEFFSLLHKIIESALPMNTSHDALRGHLRKSLASAHGVTDSSSWDQRPYVQDVFPAHVVYQHGGQTLKRSYKVAQGEKGADPVIALGTHKPVHVAYVDSKSEESQKMIFGEKEDVIITSESEDKPLQVRESITFGGEVQVKEGKGPATIPVKIIGPGWGSAAYYSKEVLKDAAKVFKKGTHMMWNHATESQDAERPEGDLNDLAAVLIKDATWQDDGVKGPGLYSEAKVFSDYATQVAEKGAHIGVSINAGIKAHEGEAEGKTGRIADKFVHAFSTDFVTKAGAGGAPIVPVTESATEPVRTDAPLNQNGGNGMTPEETKAQEALQTENAALKAKVVTMEAGQNHIVAVATVGAVLREADIPFKQSLLERACKDPVMKEGKVDPEWVKSIVADFTTEAGGGRVTGNGHAKENADNKKSLEESLKSLGVPEAGLKYAVEGRV